MIAEKSASKEEVAPPRFLNLSDDLATAVFGSDNLGRHYAEKCTDFNAGQ